MDLGVSLTVELRQPKWGFGPLTWILWLGPSCLVCCSLSCSVEPPPPAAGVPGGLQNFVEMIVEFINETTQSIFQHKNDLIASGDDHLFGCF